MKLHHLTLVLLLTLSGPIRSLAQIYADLSLDEGTNHLGVVRIELHHNQAPRPCANFIGLATGERPWINPFTGNVETNSPFYDGLIFHRLVHSFVLQGGDPLGTGTGGPGYVWQDQFAPGLNHSTNRYTVSMAHSGPNSNGSQFFITLGDASFLDEYHSVFGTVVDHPDTPNSRALIDNFRNHVAFPTNNVSRPLTDIIMRSVTITGEVSEINGFDVMAPELLLPTVRNVRSELNFTNDAVQIASYDWAVQNSHEYLIFSNLDPLTTWGRQFNLLTFLSNETVRVDIQPLLQVNAQQYYLATEIDYSHAPVFPSDLFGNQNRLEFDTEAGELAILFDTNTGGTWQFTDTNSLVTTGALTQLVFSNPGQYPNVTAGPNFLSAAYPSLARFISVREITAFFDQPVGPQLINAIQPTLSFHTATHGWYNGAVSSDLAILPRFRGSFEFTKAP